MTESDVLQDLRSHVAMLTGAEAGEVATDLPLHRLGLDSMGFVDLLVFIEKQYHLPLMSSGLSNDDFASLKVLTQRIVQTARQ